MKKVFSFISLITFQAVLSIIIGILFSKMSWFGKLGISLVHTEYKILKVWWKSALVVFFIQLLLIFIQWFIRKHCNNKLSIFLLLLFLFGGIVGLYFTYHDFTYTYEHRILKDKFHLGGYLFWAGWLATNLYFLFSSGKKKLPAKNIENNSEQNTDPNPII